MQTVLSMHGLWHFFWLHGIAIFGMPPGPVKLFPAPRWRVPHGQLTNHCLIASIAGHISLTDISSDSDVDEDSELTHLPRAWWLLGPHDGPAINQPDQAPRARCFVLVPDKIVPHPRRRANVRDGGFENAMLVPVLAVEVAPMQTSVVDSIAVPRFHYVDFAILGPLEGVFRQQPKGRPDTSGHRRRNSGRQTAPWSAEGLVTRQSGAGKLLRRVGMSVVDQSAHDHRIALG